MQATNKRIVVADYAGHPFQAQLSRALARRGHAVLHLHFAEFQTPKGRLALSQDDPPGLEIGAVALGKPFAKHHLARRWLQEIEIGKKFAERIIAFDPDVAIAANLPLDTLRAAQDALRSPRRQFVFWQQDIYSAAIARILKQKLGWAAGAAIGAWYHGLERRIMQQSDAIVVIAEDFVHYIRDEMRVADRPIHVIENWAPIDEIAVRPKDNAWARAHGLADRTVVLYTGTLGMKHDPGIILSIAQAFRNRPDCRVVVASEGPAADWLKQKKNELRLSSLLLLGFQPFESYPDVLGTGDIVLSILEEGAGAFSVPSKVLSYLCAARPIIFHGPETNLAAKIIMRTGAGLVCPNGARGEFIAMVSRLAANPALRAEMGERGRAYAEASFDIEAIAGRFEAVFETVRNGRVAA